MSELLGGTHFLCLRSDTNRRTVYCYRRFDDAIAHVDAYTRLSPIFSLNGADHPTFGGDSTSYLFFLGPIYPGSVPLSSFRSAFLTLGLYNILLVCRDELERQAVRTLLPTLSVSWEEWQVRGHELLEYDCGYPRGVAPRSSSDPLGGIPPQMLPTARECLGQLRSATSRAALHGAPTTDVLQRFEVGLRDLLSRDAIHEVEKLQFLVTSNVALSRHRWQTYSGTATILDNPCHFATRLSATESTTDPPRSKRRSTPPDSAEPPEARLQRRT